MLFKKKLAWYSIINYTTDFVQIPKNFMLVSIICFHTLFKIPRCN